MKFKDVSISKVIILVGLVVTILYSLFLGMENVTLTALGGLIGYLTKDIDSLVNKPKEKTIADVLEEQGFNVGEIGVQEIKEEEED